jgi:hypothetical protein
MATTKSKLLKAVKRNATQEAKEVYDLLNLLDKTDIDFSKEYHYDLINESHDKNIQTPKLSNSTDAMFVL